MDKNNNNFGAGKSLKGMGKGKGKGYGQGKDIGRPITSTPKVSDPTRGSGETPRDMMSGQAQNNQAKASASRSARKTANPNG